MLLARIAAELRADAELASCLLPVRFMEESDEVFSAADFWLEALFYLALAIDKPSPEFARSLRDTREDLASRWRERELDERARAAVLEAADTLGMRLVLMVEIAAELRACTRQRWTPTASTVRQRGRRLRLEAAQDAARTGATSGSRYGFVPQGHEPDQEWSRG